MPLSLTCACGARFELDESLAGQEVLCPDCQQKMQAPALTSPAARLRTSDWALASMVLALLGAFTVVGTVAAVVCGVVALVIIGRHRDRVAGAGFALFGIIAGVAFTTLTVFALARGDLFGLGAFARERQLGGQIDRTGPDEVVRPQQGFSLTRPTRRWGVAVNSEAVNGLLDYPEVEPLLSRPDLLLVEPRRNAYVDVEQSRGGPFRDLDGLQNYALEELRSGPPGRRDGPMHNASVRVESQSDLGRSGNGLGRELVVDVMCGQAWRMIVRLYVVDNGRSYIVRGFSPRRPFKANEEELRQALDSFRVLR
jgi:hypothetical protein